MKEGRHASQSRRRSTVEGPSLQVICLGSSGGPSEDNASGLLVRSATSKWSTGSLLAVDAGSHLAAIVRILENDFPLYANNQHVRVNLHGSSDSGSPDRSSSPEAPPKVLATGPFAGVPFPFASARANALHVVKEHVATYLITHPHLDHLCAFAMNTAAFHNTSRPKKLAALPFTVEAIKQHIFNDVIWPNLTDEDSGVGFVTFQRLTEGGNLALGEGESRGYIEVCNGLAAKAFRISHGNCASKPPVNVAVSEMGRRASVPHIPESPVHTHAHSALGHGMRTPLAATTDAMGRRTSGYTNSQPLTPTLFPQNNGSGHIPDSLSCVVDSSAFFIRAEATGREVLIWGDVEPDSLSAIPRNQYVWAEAATKFVQGSLGGVFIECSYGDSQADSVLFGHLAPRHVIAELLVLAEKVVQARSAIALPNSTSNLGNKRKRFSGFGSSALDSDSSKSISRKRSGSKQYAHVGAHAATAHPATPLSTSTIADHDQSMDACVSPRSDATAPESRLCSPLLPMRSFQPNVNAIDGPLKGLRVVIIHVKDDMQDGPSLSDVIIEELEAHEAELKENGRGLGCDFEISRPGESYWF